VKLARLILSRDEQSGSYDWIIVAPGKPVTSGSHSSVRDGQTVPTDIPSAIQPLNSRIAVKEIVRTVCRFLIVRRTAQRDVRSRI
jgi:hypothetical protein